MVFGVSPAMLLVKLPVPPPSLDLLSAMVGVALVPQQTPRAVIVAPPSEVIAPPPVAVVCVISVTDAVVVDGAIDTSSFLQPFGSSKSNPMMVNGIVQMLFLFFMRHVLIEWII